MESHEWTYTYKLNVFLTKWEKGFGEEPQARERKCAILELEMNSEKRESRFCYIWHGFCYLSIEWDGGQYGP
jgi:hypothetical protein